MSAYDIRAHDGAVGLAGRVGNVFLTGYGASRTFDIAGGIYAMMEQLREWNEARLTRKSLEALSDRELDDIGLSRSDIALVCRPR